MHLIDEVRESLGRVAIAPLLYLLFVAAGAGSLHAQPLNCEVNGKSVNPSNGYTTQGLSGMMVCRHEDGRIQREQELRDGKFIGLDRIVGFDGMVRERQVNDRGNTDGRMTERDAQGRLRYEGQYSNGRSVGVHRRYDEAGKLRRITFYEAEQERAAFDYNADGSLHELRCAKVSVVPEDRVPCGFDAKPQTVELRNERFVFARETRQAGALIARTGLRADGTVQSELLMESGKRVSREYGDDGKSLRRERVFEVDDGSLRAGGPLVREREWAGRDQLVRDARYDKGLLVAEELWHQNGQPKARRAIETETINSRRVATVREESFRDDGSLAARNIERDHMPVGLQRYYDERGQLRREDNYSSPPAGSRERSRLLSRKTWDEGGRVVSDDEFFEDGSRKAR